MNRFKTFLLLAFLFLAAPLQAHDEGHGPKLTESGNYGGILSAVVDFKEAPKGSKATLLYKAELVHTEEGVIRVYLYDKTLKPLPLEGFQKTVEGKINQEGVKQPLTLSLQLEGNSFVGKLPPALKKPFDLDLYFKSGSQTLLTAFDRLD